MTKFMFTELSPEMRQKMTANLLRLPAHMRFKGKRTLQCDFCSGDNVMYAYAAHRMTSGQIQDCWRWLACPECHAALQANDYNKVYDRAAAVFQDPEKAKGVIRAVLLAFHADAVSEEA